MRHRAATVLLAALATSLLLCVAAVATERLGLRSPLATLDRYASDRFVRDRNQRVPVPGFRAFYPELVLVNIDDASLRAVGRWPWSRAVFARLHHRLAAAGARVVASDVLFTQRSVRVAEDRALARSLEALPAAVLGTLYRATPSSEVQVDRPLDWIWPRLPETVRSAAVGVTPDDDGVLRSVTAAVPRPGAPPLPALALAAWSAARGLHPEVVDLDPEAVRAGSLRIPVRARLDWPIPALARFETAQGYRDIFPLCEMVPFADALSMPPALARRVFGGRIVLIGSMAQAFKEDVKPTPLGPMPGLAVHACLLVDLLEGRFLWEWPRAVDAAVLVLSALLLGGMVLRFHPLAALVGAALLFLAWWETARWLFLTHSIVVGVALPALNGAVFTVLVVLQNAFEAREKGDIRHIFGEYLSPSLVDDLVRARREGRLGLSGKREKVSVFFGDIRSFTPMAESMPPEDVVTLLDDYFAVLTEIAARHGGYIDKFAGDGIMIVYSAPLPATDDALRAVRAAWEMQQALTERNRAWQAAGRPPVHVGMGIDTGDVVLGNLGSPLKKQYTVIGDHVNVAARLCAAAAGGQILLTAATLQQVREHVRVAPLPPLFVKGKSQPLEVYELKGVTSDEEDGIRPVDDRPARDAAAGPERAQPPVHPRAGIGPVQADRRD